MKILVIITNSDRAGAQKHVLSLVEGLKKNHEYSVLVGNRGYLTTELKKLEVPFTVIPELIRAVNPIIDLKCILKLHREIINFSPEIVHLHSAKAGALGRIACVKKNLSIIYTVHGWAFSEGNSLIKKLASLFVEKALARFTSYFILVSKYDFDLGKKYKLVGHTNSKIIYNGVVDIPPASAHKDITIFSATRLAKQKNIPLMVRVFDQLTRQYTAVIAGDGPMNNQIKKMIDNMGLRDKVLLVGETNNVHEFLLRSELFLLTSDWEGLPISLIEALRAGIPIVATNVGGVSEMVTAGENGYLASRGDATSLSSYINKLIENNDLRNTMGARSRKRFLDKFQVKQMIEQTGGVYTSLTQFK